MPTGLFICPGGVEYDPASLWVASGGGGTAAVGGPGGGGVPLIAAGPAVGGWPYR